MKKRTLIATIFLHALFLLTVYTLQGVIFPFIRINGLVPLMLPVAGTGIALYEGRNVGGIAGLFAGILCDISFNQPAGIFTVLLTFTGLFVGTLADTVILRGFVTYYICCTAVLIVCALVQTAPFIIIPARLASGQALISTSIQQTIYSLILAFPLWFIVRALGKHAERFLPAERPAHILVSLKSLRNKKG